MKYLLFLISLCSLSCQRDERVYVNRTKDSTITAQKISLNELDKTLKELHGRYIDIQGVFWNEFENVSICPEFESIKHFIPRCYWLGFDTSLYKYDLQALSGHRVRIKGRIDTLERGHLSMYRAGIKDIYFIEDRQ